METVYRKVAVSERKPKEGWVLTPDGGWLFKDNKFKCAHSGEVQVSGSITHWLEPIKSAQLQADKAELLEALENLINDEQLSNDSIIDEIESIIQKHKQ